MINLGNDFEFFADGSDLVIFELPQRELVKMNWSVIDEVEVEVDPIVILGAV